MPRASRAGAAVLLLSLMAVLLSTACKTGSPEDSAVRIETVTPPATAASSPTLRIEPKLSGYIFPIVGGCLPEGDQLLPNAPRSYRNGFHEGLDLYESDNCTNIRRGTGVVAARDGTIARADTAYSELTASELKQLSLNPTTPAALDRFRGRQVWIDHGDGVVTRYAHLSGVAPGIAAGNPVKAGDLIAFVGESGTPESVNSPGTDNHLHFELRIGDGFLGQGLQGPAVRSAYEKLFDP